MYKIFQGKILITSLVFIVATGQIHAHDYGTKDWWDHFWTTSEGWGEPNDRVTSLLKLLDGSKDIITVVDVGSGNGRNSILALEKLFQTQKPKSRFVVHCIDYSEKALQGLRNRTLPNWLELITQKSDLNVVESISFPKADLFLLYGVLECIPDKNVTPVLNLASRAVNSNGFLLFVSLVQGDGALDIERELIRPARVYTQYLKALNNLEFVDTPKINIKYDRHDLGKGYPEDHIHYVYRTVMVKENVKKES